MALYIIHRLILAFPGFHRNKKHKISIMDVLKRGHIYKVINIDLHESVCSLVVSQGRILD